MFFYGRTVIWDCLTYRELNLRVMKCLPFCSALVFRCFGFGEVSSGMVG
jgi:hypothetical protein